MSYIFVALKIQSLEKYINETLSPAPPRSHSSAGTLVNSYMVLLSDFLFCRVYKALSHTSSLWNLTTAVFNYKCEIGEIVFQWTLITFSQKGATVTDYLLFPFLQTQARIYLLWPFMLHSYNKEQTGLWRAESIQNLLSALVLSATALAKHKTFAWVIDKDGAVFQNTIKDASSRSLTKKNVGLASLKCGIKRKESHVFYK